MELQGERAGLGQPLPSLSFSFFIFKMTTHDQQISEGPLALPFQILYSVEQKVHDAFKSTKNL